MSLPQRHGLQERAEMSSVPGTSWNIPLKLAAAGAKRLPGDQTLLSEAMPTPWVPPAWLQGRGAPGRTMNGLNHEAENVG